MHEPLDAPLQLSFSNGKLFPPNAVFMGYVFMVVSCFSLFMGGWILSLILLSIALLTAFTNYGIRFDPGRQTFTEFTHYLGLIPIEKTLSYASWKYITVIPLKSTTTLFSRSTNSTSITTYYYTICLLNANYRNKKELTKFESKSTSDEIAKQLSERLGLEFFEYDPLTIREAFKRR